MILLVILSLFSRHVLGDDTTVASSELDNRSNVSKLVIEDQSTEIHVSPWLVSIHTDNLHFCSGSIVTERIILTAAHCATKYPADTLSVRVGSSKVDSGGSWHKVVEIKHHGSYEKLASHFVNDVALIKVSPPIEFSRNATSVVLASRGDVVAPGTVASVAGWGSASEVYPALGNTSLAIFHNSKCAKDYRNSSGVWMNLDRQICAATFGTSSCRGDSGGPLMVNGSQIGLASWGLGCARPNYPGVYADVALHRDWIDSNLRALDPTNTASESDSFFLGVWYKLKFW